MTNHSSPSSSDMQETLERLARGATSNQENASVVAYVASLEADLATSIKAHRWLLENAKRIFDKVPVRDWDEVLSNSEHVRPSLQVHE